MKFHQLVTHRIVEQLQSGLIPWRPTWPNGLPKSLSTRQEFHGLNLLLLGGTRFTSPYWVSACGAWCRRGRIRPGAEASRVIFWPRHMLAPVTALWNTTGHDDLVHGWPGSSRVFNLDQIDGIARPADDGPRTQQRRLQLAARLLAFAPDKPEIVHGATDAPGYDPATDRITLPHLSQLRSGAEYYFLLFRALVRSTGHPRRLNRFGTSPGELFPPYGFEDLVAEIGAAFLGGFAGLAHPVKEEQRAAYIQGWTHALRNDVRLLLRAVTAAQHAVDSIRGKIVLML